MSPENASSHSFAGSSRELRRLFRKKPYVLLERISIPPTAMRALMMSKNDVPMRPQNMPSDSSAGSPEELRTPSLKRPYVHIERTFVPSGRLKTCSGSSRRMSWGIISTSSESTSSGSYLGSFEQLRTPSLRKPYVHIERTVAPSGKYQPSARRARRISRIIIPMSPENMTTEELRTPLKKPYVHGEETCAPSRTLKTYSRSVRGVSKKFAPNKVMKDDDEGHLHFSVGDSIAQYDLLAYIGRGTFGKVAKARNVDTFQIVALKIVRNTNGSRESARNEILTLNGLRELDPEGKYLWIRMLDNFEFQGHVCIAFEKLGESLYSLMKSNAYRPFPLEQLRHMVYQICYSVKALHANLIIHTDLKPENICLVSSDHTFGMRRTRSRSYRKPISTNIRLIDFGSAIDFFDDRDIMIQTRYYRAPEVVFGLKWNETVDVWSIGCILFELYTGQCLFTAHTDDEHYHSMVDALGPFPEMYHSTKLVKMHENATFPCKKKSRKPLRRYMHMSRPEHKDAFDLMQKMLNYNPQERIKLDDALNHPFFSLLSDDQKLEE